LGGFHHSQQHSWASGSTSSQETLCNTLVLIREEHAFPRSQTSDSTGQCEWGDFSF